MDDPDNTLEKLVLEAVKVCGPDVKAVERRVASQLESADPSERERINENVRRLLSFRAPGFQERGPQ